METVYIETNGFLYIKNFKKTDLENDKYNKLWFWSKLPKDKKYNPQLSHNSTEKLVNQQRLKLEYPDGNEINSNFSLW